MSIMVALWYLVVVHEGISAASTAIPQISREQCLMSAEYARQVDKGVISYCIPGVALGWKS